MDYIRVHVSVYQAGRPQVRSLLYSNFDSQSWVQITLCPLHLSPNTFSPHSDLRRLRWKFHTIFLHSSGCTSAGSQYVAIIGPVVGAESKAINPFLLLFAPWLAVTGCSVIGQEHTCPLHFTLISPQLQTLIPARLRIPLLPPISTQSLFPVLPLPPVNSPPSPCWANLRPRWSTELRLKWVK